MADTYNEMQSLTLNGKKYDSFRDQTARQQLEELKNNGSDSTQNQNGGGLSTTAAALLITILRDGMYTTDQSANITALAEALSASEDEPDTPVEPDEPVDPEVTLTSISAVYNGGAVPVGTAVADLTGIVVTAHYSDGSTATVTDYTLSGTIAEGSNTVTVTYQGKTATVTVTGVAEDEPETIELPDGYTQLSYISNMKSQDSTINTNASFDTGVVPTEHTNAEYKINYVVMDGQVNQVLCADGFHFPKGGSGGWQANKLGSSNQNVVGLDGVTAGVDYVVSAFGTGNQVIVDGVVGTVVIGNTPTEDTLCLFGDVAQANPVIWHAKCKIYYCKIWEGDSLIRNFIPCSNPDGVIGMYDVANGKFYTNESEFATNGDPVFIGGDPV